MAADLNEVRVEGGITQEPTSGYSDGGAPYWRANIASEGTRYDAQTRTSQVQTTFVYATAWGYPAEQLMEANLGKGDKIRIEGSIANRVKEENGVKETKTHIDIKLFHILRQRTGARPTPAANNVGGGWGNERPSGGGWPADTEPPF
jgi:single-stranded DNA-binding protein